MSDFDVTSDIWTAKSLSSGIRKIESIADVTSFGDISYSYVIAIANSVDKAIAIAVGIVLGKDVRMSKY